MTNVNWDEAPEDATHYWDTGDGIWCQQDSMCKCLYFFMNDEKLWWYPGSDLKIVDISVLIPRPV